MINTAETQLWEKQIHKLFPTSSLLTVDKKFVSW